MAQPDQSDLGGTHLIEGIQKYNSRHVQTIGAGYKG